MDATTAEFAKSRDLPGAGVGLRGRIVGPEDGPLVILLHGFPETAHGWRRLAPALARAGLRVVAPDQRGYAESDKPRGTAAYDIDRLSDDVLALAEGLGRERFALVGHDWGGVVAWWTAARAPDRVSRLAVMNAPHPGVLGAVLRRDPAQMLRSAYIGLFRLPGVAEALLSAGGHLMLRRALVRTAKRGAFQPADVQAYVRAWAEPGALTAMLNWYRALRPCEPLRVSPPTLLLWGERDRFLGRALAGASLELCDRGAARWFPRATHWIQHEELAGVSEALVPFLTRARAEA